MAICPSCNKPWGQVASGQSVTCHGCRVPFLDMIAKSTGIPYDILIGDLDDLIDLELKQHRPNRAIQTFIRVIREHLDDDLNLNPKYDDAVIVGMAVHAAQAGMEVEIILRNSPSLQIVRVQAAQHIRPGDLLRATNDGRVRPI